MGITLALALAGILTVGIIDMIEMDARSGAVMVDTLPPSKPKIRPVAEPRPVAERRRPPSEPLQLRTSML